MQRSAGSAILCRGSCRRSAQREQRRNGPDSSPAEPLPASAAPCGNLSRTALPVVQGDVTRARIAGAAGGPRAGSCPRQHRAVSITGPLYSAALGQHPGGPDADEVAGARRGAGAHAVGAREPPSRRRRGRGPARGAQRAGDRHRRPANRHDARHAEDARMASGRRGGVPAGLRDHPQLLPIACVALQRPLRPQPWGPATAAGRQPQPQLHAAAALEGQRLLHGDGRKVPQPVESRNPTAVLRPLRGRQRRVQQRQLGRRRRGPADPGLHHHDHRRQGDRVPERLRGR
jgi:hypothetical protein